MKKLLLGLFLISALPVNAASFNNGDFSSGGTSWNDASDTGSVTFSAGQAILETGTGVSGFSAVMVQGDDGFFNFPNPISLASDAKWLSFSAKIDELGADNTESSSIFTDALNVYLYDALDFNLDLLFLTIDSDSYSLGFISYMLDVSSLQGRDIALSFELVDENNERNSSVTIDNVAFSAAVPAPSVLVLLLVGLPFLGRNYKKSKA